MSLLTPHYSDLVDMVQPLDPFHPLSRGCVAAYLTRAGMGGGNRLIDLHNPGPHGKHGILTGGPAWTHTPWGTPAVVCETNGKHIDVSSSVLSSRSAIQFWFNGSGTPHSSGKLFMGPEGTDIQLYRYSSGTSLSLYINGVAGAFSGLADLWDTSWHSIYVAWDAAINERHLYIDGIPDEPVTSAFTWPVLGATLTFGDAVGNDRTCGGRLSDIVVFSDWRTSAEITTLASARSDPTYGGWIQSPRRWFPAAVAGGASGSLLTRMQAEGLYVGSLA